MTTAVIGAAGYLGTQMLLCLQDEGRPAVGIDVSGALVPALSTVPFVLVGRDDPTRLATALTEHGVTQIVHFAGGSGAVDLSVSDPLAEYEDTLIRTLTATRAAVEAGVDRLVFSSTASVYGVPDRMPIAEETALRPISPFGAAMGMAERVVADASRAAGIRVATLRYFNVAGADPALRAGETGRPRHLIRAAAQVSVGTRKEPLRIYGDDYETPDGTPIRDFLHVADMAEAHLAALDYLCEGGRSVVLNCGYGEGASVREVVSAVARVTGRALPTVVAPRRAGDPPQLIADDAKVRSTLRWTPRFNDLDLIVRSAIDWEAAQEDAPGRQAAE
ncbi:UDP-glucose 4-epimerase GalE [Parvularcula dongshanensis]|uniref:UDP-glucose 4-epimerase n=1 Tax=Parvularcula dongshanensis TaxID=1173995 RepID=A0A840I1J8_9PROT|nr:UDP-glucose 4-epimerase [Parvularcula dongshanensis]